MHFDKERVPCNHEASRYYIEYYVYRDEENRIDSLNEKDLEKYELKNKKNTNTSCFAELSAMLTRFSLENQVWPNRLLFLCDFKKHLTAKHHTTIENREWWIETCKKHNFLPDYIADSFVKTGNLILKIDILDLKIMYIYLSTTRLLQEEPYFVTAVEYLVKEMGLGFYTAFAVASRCCISNKSHHVIPVGKQYPFYNEKDNDINKIETFQTYQIYKLKNFLRRVDKDQIIIKDQDVGTKYGCFNLHSTLDKIDVDNDERTVSRKELTRLFESVKPDSPAVVKNEISVNGFLWPSI